MCIKFIDVKWSNISLPENFIKNIRKDFLVDKDGQLFDYNDLHDILAAYLHDEFGVVPLSFRFDIQSQMS